MRRDPQKISLGKEPRRAKRPVRPRATGHHWLAVAPGGTLWVSNGQYTGAVFDNNFQSRRIAQVERRHLHALKVALRRAYRTDD